MFHEFPKNGVSGGAVSVQLHKANEGYVKMRRIVI